LTTIFFIKNKEILSIENINSMAEKNSEIKNYLLYNNTKLNKMIMNSPHYSYLRGWSEAMKTYHEVSEVINQLTEPKAA
jgi:hypothetical protein